MSEIKRAKLFGKIEGEKNNKYGVDKDEIKNYIYIYILERFYLQINAKANSLNFLPEL